jgi:transposase-like protein
LLRGRSLDEDVDFLLTHSRNGRVIRIRADDMKEVLLTHSRNGRVIRIRADDMKEVLLTHGGEIRERSEFDEERRIVFTR